jgi:hypothetical protein
LEFLKKVESKQREFRSWLRHKRTDYPLSLLFWVEELQAIRGIVYCPHCNIDELEEITMIIDRLRPLSVIPISVDAVRRGVAIAKRWMDTVKTSWFEVVALFLSKIIDYGPQIRSSSACRIDLHSMFCEEVEAANEILRLTCYIYKVWLSDTNQTLPFPSEIC